MSVDFVPEVVMTGILDEIATSVRYVQVYYINVKTNSKRYSNNCEHILKKTTIVHIDFFHIIV